MARFLSLINRRIQISQWAQALLQLANLVFFVVDTTGLEKDADIIRLLIVDLSGATLYDQHVKPMRYPHSPNGNYTDISQEQIDAAATLAEQWDAFRAVLVGKIVLIYGEDFAREKLDENAAYYSLPPALFISDCLMAEASKYFDKQSRYGLSNISLAEACNRTSYPRLIGPSALDRAAAQIALLKAIADGQPKAPAPATPPEIELPQDMLDHPF